MTWYARRSRALGHRTRARGAERASAPSSAWQPALPAHRAACDCDSRPRGAAWHTSQEKNWVPFVHAGALLLSYSVQPHIVLQCAWAGGRCHVAHNTSSDFLQMYSTLEQELRGGTPYVDLGDGTMLAVMHSKDTSHEPPLYGCILYLVEAKPPFRILSLSPKVCLSERRLELASSARCALQYAVGLHVDPARNLALISFGEFDLKMKLATLALDRAVALARTHLLDHEAEAFSECARFGFEEHW